jgi:hypothetical protein
MFSRRVRAALAAHDFDIVHGQGPDSLAHNVITAHFCYRAWNEITKKLSVLDFLIKFFRPMYRVCLAHDDRRPDPAVFLDGRPLEKVRWLGELFPPLTTEALPGPRQLHFFEVPLDTLTADAHEFTVVQRGDRVDGVHSFELALYGRDSLLSNR